VDSSLDEENGEARDEHGRLGAPRAPEPGGHEGERSQCYREWKPGDTRLLWQALPRSRDRRGSWGKLDLSRAQTRMSQGRPSRSQQEQNSCQP
jgi:hypothetical protein